MDILSSPIWNEQDPADFTNPGALRAVADQDRSLAFTDVERVSISKTDFTGTQETSRNDAPCSANGSAKRWVKTARVFDSLGYQDSKPTGMMYNFKNRQLSIK